MDTTSREEDPGLKSPFDIVLRGGYPWGFNLRGGARESTPLQVCEVSGRYSKRGRSADLIRARGVV